jgi:hypothetical protein
MTEMTSHHDKVVGRLRRSVEEYMEERPLSQIGDHTIIREECLSEEVRSLRRDLTFITRSFGSSHMVLIDISCPDGCISYRMSPLEKLYLDKKEKYSRLAQETSNIREIRVAIIPISVSS